MVETLGSERVMGWKRPWAKGMLGEGPRLREGWDRSLMLVLGSGVLGHWGKRGFWAVSGELELRNFRIVGVVGVIECCG